jgi:hypothetical protein
MEIGKNIVSEEDFKHFICDSVTGTLTKEIFENNKRATELTFEYLFNRLLDEGRYGELNILLISNIDKVSTILPSYKIMSSLLAKKYIDTGGREEIVMVHLELMDQVNNNKNVDIIYDDFIAYFMMNDCLPLFKNIYETFKNEACLSFVEHIKIFLPHTLTKNVRHVIKVIQYLMNDSLFVETLKDQMYSSIIIPFLTLEQFHKFCSLEQLNMDITIDKSMLIKNLITYDNVELFAFLQDNSYLDDIVVIHHDFIVSSGAYKIFERIKDYDFKNSNCKPQFQYNNFMLIDAINTYFGSKHMNEETSIICAHYLQYVNSSEIYVYSVAPFRYLNIVKALSDKNKFKRVHTFLYNLLITGESIDKYKTKTIIPDAVKFYIEFCDRSKSTTPEDIEFCSSFIALFDDATNIHTESIFSANYLTIPWLVLMGRPDLVNISELNKKEIEEIPIGFDIALLVISSQYKKKCALQELFVNYMSLNNDSRVWICNAVNSIPNFDVSAIFMTCLFVDDEMNASLLYSIERKQCVDALIKYNMTIMDDIKTGVGEKFIEYVVETEKNNGNFIPHFLFPIIYKNNHVSLFIKHRLYLQNTHAFITLSIMGHFKYSYGSSILFILFNFYYSTEKLFEENRLLFDISNGSDMRLILLFDYLRENMTTDTEFTVIEKTSFIDFENHHKSLMSSQRKKLFKNLSSKGMFNACKILLDAETYTQEDIKKFDKINADKVLSVDGFLSRKERMTIMKSKRSILSSRKSMQITKECCKDIQDVLPVFLCESIIKQYPDITKESSFFANNLLKTTSVSFYEKIKDQLFENKSAMRYAIRHSQQLFPQVFMSIRNFSAENRTKLDDVRVHSVHNILALLKTNCIKSASNLCMDSLAKEDDEYGHNRMILFNTVVMILFNYKLSPTLIKFIIKKNECQRPATKRPQFIGPCLLSMLGRCIFPMLPLHKKDFDTYFKIVEDDTISSEECKICIFDKCSVSLSCGHNLCAICMKKNKSITCPLCMKCFDDVVVTQAYIDEIKKDAEIKNENKINGIDDHDSSEDSSSEEESLYSQTPSRTPSRTSNISDYLNLETQNDKVVESAIFYTNSVCSSNDYERFDKSLEHVSRYGCSYISINDFKYNIDESKQNTKASKKARRDRYDMFDIFGSGDSSDSCISHEEESDYDDESDCSEEVIEWDEEDNDEEEEEDNDENGNEEEDDIDESSNEGETNASQTRNGDEVEHWEDCSSDESECCEDC